MITSDASERSERANGHRLSAEGGVQRCSIPDQIGDPTLPASLALRNELGERAEAMRWLARQLRWERTLDALRQQVGAGPAPLRAEPEPRAA